MVEIRILLVYLHTPVYIVFNKQYMTNIRKKPSLVTDSIPCHGFILLLINNLGPEYLGTRQFEIKTIKFLNIIKRIPHSNTYL